ncbi:MAG: arylesterase [Chromatiales bacterium]|jgi:acyl-CoA thioesterase I|nr:arylesterase [Chromatiales bacterium]
MKIHFTERLWAVRILFVTVCIVFAAPGFAYAGGPIVVLGDSLSAGYGIRVEEGWVSLLRTRLAEEGVERKVINASISGDTTFGGITRLPKLLERISPGVLIVELGGNDGLRGIAIKETRRNLQSIVRAGLHGGFAVVLVGMRLPPNLGPAFSKAFERIFRDVAEELDVPLVPFLLAGVALTPGQMQADGIHPNALGQGRMLNNVWPKLAPIL